MKIKAVLTDIEGTTTPISFVKDVLFPFSYEKVESFLKENWDSPEVREILYSIEQIEGMSLSFEEVVRILKGWIKEDRKITPLKQLQGLIWEEGYKSGDIKAYIYPDAYDRLKQWWDKGIRLCVYSSGSVKAQKLLFSHTNYGDITYLFSDYFDTTVGSKLDKTSYEKISNQLNLPPEEILFLSDNPDEIIAGASAGMKVIRLVRDGDTEFIEGFEYPQVSSFWDIEL